MRVREASADDAEGINKAVKQSWLDTYQEIQSQDKLKKIRERDEILPLEDLKESVRTDGTLILIAEMCGEIVGELIMKKSGEEKHIDYSREVFLKSLYILPDEQRDGVGEKMVEKALGRVDRTVKIRVLKENKGARKFYRQLGFQKVSETEIGGEEKNIFTEKHEAVVMENY
jgi:ribosomal protein S18 acetylase RimI-like enzyme